MSAPNPYVGAAARAAHDLMDDDDPRRRVLAAVLAAFVIAREAEDEDVDGVFILPDSNQHIGAALVCEPEEGLRLLLHGACGVAIQALGFNLDQTIALLRASWGEKKAEGMSRVGAHRSAGTRRRPATKRGRGKRAR